MITMMEHIFGNYCVDDDFKVTLKTFRFFKSLFMLLLLLFSLFAVICMYEHALTSNSSISAMNWKRDANEMKNGVFLRGNQHKTTATTTTSLTVNNNNKHCVSKHNLSELKVVVVVFSHFIFKVAKHNKNKKIFTTKWNENCHPRKKIK